MGVFVSVLVDQAHSSAWALDRESAARLNPANPADASLARAAAVLQARGASVTAHRDGPLTPAALADHDVLVIAHPAAAGTERVAGALPPVYGPEEIAAVIEHVRRGGGLVVLAECDHDAHGNNVSELLAPFGLGVVSTLVHESADSGRRHLGNATWVRAELDLGPTGHGQGVLAGIADVCFYRAGALSIEDPADDEATPAQLADRAARGPARVLARSSATAHPAGAPLLITRPFGDGRVVLVADSDLVGDDSIDELDHAELWVNLVSWAGAASAGRADEEGATPLRPADLAQTLQGSADWHALKAAVEELRGLQSQDGSIDTTRHDPDRARQLVAAIIDRLAALAPHLPHDADYLAALPGDLMRWVESDFAVPDFLDSLLAFRPETHRVDGAVHLVLFPMYTQNGNPDRVFEAVLLQVSWPDWLAEVEATQTNPMFLPVTFVDFTPGYDTNSAVLFPETIAVREVPRFTWGAIFCDREAARFRQIATAAATTLGLDLPPEAERLLAHQELAQSTFALWDLIHDRTHSHGDLPFDPFMIKQRMPYWMYALEELRCDLHTFREAVRLQEQGQPYARSVQLAILFDRLFRFPITGERVRNYDGLGGQLLFAWLHRRGVLRWSDNRLTFDWCALPEAVLALSDAIEELYRAGIDRSRVGHWVAAYELVSAQVAPHPASTWAKGAAALPLDGPPKGLTDLVQPDEFPLNVFYEALRKKLAPVLEATTGITGSSAVGGRIAA